MASKAGNAALAAVTIAFLKDENDGVVLWGLQTAKNVVPAALMATDSKNAITIGKLVLAAVQKRDLSTTISEETARNILDEAYRTILLEPTLGERNAVPANYISSIGPAELTAYLPTVQDFVDYRAKTYGDPVPPKQPHDDIWAITFFTKSKVTSAQSAPQQTKTLNTMLGLLKGASSQYSAAQTPDFLEVIKNSGQGFFVMGQSLKAPALTAAGKTLNELGAGAPPAIIAADIAAVEEALTPTPH